MDIIEKIRHNCFQNALLETINEPLSILNLAENKVSGFNGVKFSALDRAGFKHLADVYFTFCKEEYGFEWKDETIEDGMGVEPTEGDNHYTEENGWLLRFPPYVGVIIQRALHKFIIERARQKFDSKMNEKFIRAVSALAA